MKYIREDDILIRTRQKFEEELTNTIFLGPILKQVEQAGAELAQAQLKRGLGFTSVVLY